MNDVDRLSLVRATALALAWTTALACGGSNDPMDPQPDAGPAGLEPPPADRGLQLTQSYRLDPGVETHRCRYVVMPDRPVDVVRFEHAFSDGGHHILLYPTSLDADDVADDLEPFDCGDRDLPTTGYTYVRQRRADQEIYPAGVGRRFAPREVVLLESHVLNTGEAPIDVDVRLNLWFATPDAPVETEVGTLFFYHPLIHVPPYGQASARMSCSVPADLTVSALGPHMHTRGVSYRAWRAVGAGEPAGDPLVEAASWSDADPRPFDPTLQLAAGERLDFQCDYQNRDGRAVIEGPSKLADEMCILIGIYWPRQDQAFEQCMGAGSGPRLDGASTCGEALLCSEGAADDVAEEACLVDTCAASSPALGELIACIHLECEIPLACEGEACRDCVEERCGDRIDACLAAGCE